MVIPYGRQDISDDDVAAVSAVLRSEYLTQGPAVPRFETAVASRVGAAHGIAVNSATSALHVGCLALGLGPGGRLWTVPNTFVASANCALYCGADVGFVDIDAGDLNMSVSDLADRLMAARREDRLPDIVVPVHFSGRPTRQEAIHELGREFGFAIMEDASHSIGANAGGEPVGSCRWSDLTVFSFHPVKIVTTAEGGMLTTQDDRLAERARMFRSHGITRDAGAMTGGETGGWYYEQHELGYNYRLTDLQAALGLSQMERIDAFIARRNELARRYDRLLAGLPLHRPPVEFDGAAAWHLYVIEVDERKMRRRELYDAMRARGILVNVHYIPVHLQPYYRDLGFRDGDFPNAESYYQRALTIPLYAAMTDSEQDEVAGALHDLLGS